MGTVTRMGFGSTCMLYACVWAEYSGIIWVFILNWVVQTLCTSRDSLCTTSMIRAWPCVCLTVNDCFFSSWTKCCGCYWQLRSQFHSTRYLVLNTTNGFYSYLLCVINNSLGNVWKMSLVGQSVSYRYHIVLYTIVLSYWSVVVNKYILFDGWEGNMAGYCTNVRPYFHEREVMLGWEAYPQKNTGWI